LAVAPAKTAIVETAVHKRRPDMPPSRLLLALTLVALFTGHALALDADDDGVDDGVDACPRSPRGSRDHWHVDAHGCTHLQIDADLDGWCNPDRPRDARNRWLETKDEWCVGVDNCKFVPNPDQAITVPDATHGDACNPGEARRVSVSVVAVHHHTAHRAWFCVLLPMLRIRAVVGLAGVYYSALSWSLHELAVNRRLNWLLWHGAAMPSAVCCATLCLRA
jgi:hypothetical protein